MDKFTKVTGVATPLMRQNVDTDLIIRIERLVDNVTRDGLGPYCFEQIRFKPDGSEDPDCIFNQEPYRGAPIILSRENFGCGSSREHAVWALAEWGIRCVIAESFAPIFAANCVRNGVLPVVLTRAALDAMAWHELCVDLAAQTVTDGAEAYPFAIEAEPKQMLLEGLDVIDLTLTARPAIDAWTEADRKARPWVYLGAHPENPA